MDHQSSDENQSSLRVITPEENRDFDGITLDENGNEEQGHFDSQFKVYHFGDMSFTKKVIGIIAFLAILILLIFFGSIILLISAGGIFIAYIINLIR